MAVTVADLRVAVGADTKDGEAGLLRMDDKIAGLGSTAKIAAIGLAAVGVAMVGGAALGIKAAGDLEQKVANISTIKPEIDTSQVFKALNEMQTRVPQTAAELGDSLYDIFSSIDVSAEDGLKLVEKFAKGATGAGTSAQTFGTAVLGVMNAYGLAVSDADHVSDVFFNTVNKGVVTGQELATSLGPVTQSAKAAGVTLDELGGLIAGVTKEGGPAAQNINNLNNFLQKVTTKEAQKEIKALGVATTTATGEFRPTTDVLTDLKAKLGGMTEAARANALQKIFPDAQARIGAQTLLSQLDFVKEAIDENKTDAGSAASAYEKMSATFNSQWALLQNTFMSIITTIGAQLLPLITPLVSSFSQWLPGAMQATQSAASPLAGIFSGIWEAAKLLITGDFTGGIFGLQEDSPVIGALLDIRAGVQGLADVAIKVLQGDLPGAFASLQTNVLPTLLSFGSNLVTIVTDWGKAFIDWVAPMIPSLISNLLQMGASVRAWISDQIPGFMAQLKDWGLAFLDWIGPMLPGLIRKLGDIWIDVESWILRTAVQIVDGLADWAGAFLDWVGPMIPDLLRELGGLLLRIGTWILNEGVPLIVGNLKRWGGAFFEWIGPRIGPMLEELGKLLVELNDWIVKEGKPMIEAKLVEWGNAMIEWVQKDVMPNILPALGKLWTAITGWLGDRAKDMLTEAGKIGAAMVEGIRAKLVSTWDDLVAKLKGLVDQLPEAVKVLLGIHSPSKVFEEIGADVVAGLVQGIDKNGDAAKDAVNRLASATKLAMAQAVAELRGESAGQTEAFTNALASTGPEAAAHGQAQLDWLREQAPAVEALGRSYSSLKAATDAVAASDEKIKAIRADISKIDLEESQKLVPLKREELTNKGRILELDRQIRDATKVSVDSERQRLNLAIQLLPEKQKLADLEDQITAKTAGSVSAQKDALDLRAREIVLQKQLLGLGQDDTRRSAIERELDAIHNQQEAARLDAELAAIPLQKQAIEQQNIVDKTQKQIDALQQQQDLQQLQGQQRVFDLVQEKAKLEDANSTLQLQMQLESQQFEERKMHLQGELLDEMVRRESLEATRQANEQLYGEMVQGFIDSATASGLFTKDEAINVTKNLGLWDDSVKALKRIEDQVRAIPTAWTTVHTTVHRDVYESSGESAPADTNPQSPYASSFGYLVPQFDDGGVVPGQRGEPRLILAHGGETVLPTHKGAVAGPTADEIGASVAKYLAGATLRVDPDGLARLVSPRLSYAASRTIQA